MNPLVAYPSTSVVRKEDFDRTTSISEAFARHVISRQFPPERYPVRCRASAEPVRGGVLLRFTSALDTLDRAATISHRFVFVDREETRERLHALAPGAGEATTELLVLLRGDGPRPRDYCHVTVYDSDNLALATHSLVFDGSGALVPYPFTRRHVSPLPLERADLSPARDARGRRVLRMRVLLGELREPHPVYVAWQAVGLVRRDRFECTPGRREVVSDLELEGNPRLAPGDYSVIAVDGRDRLLAQALVTVTADGGPWDVTDGAAGAIATPCPS